MRFSDLYFGMADAKTEAAENPERFVSSFVNNDDAVNLIRQHKKFLVLGPKGAGKSAIAWYIRETARDNQSIVVTKDVSDLPLNEVSNLKTGESAGVTRSLTAWKLLILCGLIDAVLEDQESRLNTDHEALDVIKALRSFGFLDPTPSKAVTTASKTTIKIPLPKLGEIYTRERTAAIHLHHIVPYLAKWVASEPSPNSHILILDGLDSIYLNDSSYIPSISALVHAAYLVNQDLRLAGSRASVVLLIRTDVFSRLDLPDGSKIRGDWGIELDWRMLSGNPDQSALFRLVERKAAAATVGMQSDGLVRTFLPSKVTFASRKGKVGYRGVYDYLLNLTRHTPRDLLQLFEHIRRADAQMGGIDVQVEQKSIREGVLLYANRYFVDAVRNELVGKGESGDEGRAAVDALRSLSSRRFTREDYRTAVHEYGSEVREPDEMLRWLFFAGAIGNEVTGAGTRYMQFYHRRDDSDVHLKGTLLLHNALMYAWAIPWS